MPFAIQKSRSARLLLNGASLWMALFDHDVGKRAAVDPVVFAVHADRGFIGVQHRHLQQPFKGCKFPTGQSLMQAPHPFQKRRFTNLTSTHHLEQLRGARERHHLRNHQVGCEGDDADPVMLCMFFKLGQWVERK